MPSPTGEATAMTESASPMTGVNLRADRISIKPSDLASCINADLNLAPGSLVLRLGRTKLNTTPLQDLQIRRQVLINGHRYQAAEQALYRDYVKISTVPLSSTKSTNFQGYTPLADIQLWAFIADDGIMLKDNGSQLVPWTIAAPSTAATVAAGAGGSLTGAYYVRYTYIRKTSAGAMAAESNPSPLSAIVNPSAKVITISALVPSTDSQVTHMRIYRTLAGGSDLFFDQDIENDITTATSSQIDSSLGTEALSLTDNSPPPLASSVTLWNETFWLTRDAANPTYLWYASRFHPESIPPANFLSIGDTSDPLQWCVPYGGLLGVFSRNTKYRVMGNALSGYRAEEAMSRRGTAAYNATIATEFGVVFVARDGVWRTDFSGPDIQMSEAIFPLFAGESVNGLDPINWDAASTMRAGRYKNRYYLSYPSGSQTAPDMMMVYSFDTEQWYFYDHPVTDLYYEELNNQLLGGGQDGYVYVLESGAADGASNITLTAETKDFGGPSKDMRKLFQFIRIDADTKGDDLTCQLYVDDVLQSTHTVNTSGRTERLISVAQASMGYHWRIVFTYTGTSRIRIYAPAAIYIPLVGS